MRNFLEYPVNSVCTSHYLQRHADYAIHAAESNITVLKPLQSGLSLSLVPAAAGLLVLLQYVFRDFSNQFAKIRDF